MAHPVDTHVGKRLKLRRTLLGLSQDNIAQAVNLTFQQVQKYENGANRVSASRIYDLSRILNVPVSYFFDGLDENNKNPLPSLEEDNFSRRETLELVRAYYGIIDPQVRKKVYDLLRSLS